MDVAVHATDGNELRRISLPDGVFSIEVSMGSIYQAIKNELANRRLGTASTKGRSEVRGGGAKPWRQKGTGRARAGSRSSPIWVGGGTVFGPKPRDYSYVLPRKIKRLAMRSALSLRAQDEGCFKVVEDFTIPSGKTRDLLAILRTLVTSQKGTLILMKDDDPLLKRASRNLAGVSFRAYNRLSVHDLFYGKNIVALEGAIEELGRFYAS